LSMVVEAAYKLQGPEGLIKSEKAGCGGSNLRLTHLAPVFMSPLRPWMSL